MQEQSSPGPWTKSGQSEGGRYITIKAANGRTVARVPWSTEREAEQGTATDNADADLIAAAPDLLSLVTQYRRTVEWAIKHDDSDSEGKALKTVNLILIDQVLAKAKGETK